MNNHESLAKIKNHCPGYVAHWIYWEHGLLIMVVARYEWRGEKTYRQFHWDSGEWKEGMSSTPYPLFGLETLPHSSPFGSLVICEGEKCASLLHQLQWPALTTVLGAKNVHCSDFTPVRHFKQFLILRDNDAAGAAYASEIALALRRVNPECTIHVCNIIPDVAKGDVIDWVKKYPLCGNPWDGFSALSEEHLNRVSEALKDRIQSLSIPIEDCVEIGFKTELVLFDGDPCALEEKLRPVPTFPIDLLSEDVRKYVEISARQLSIPVDFPVTTLLSLVGGILGRGIRLEMRAGQRWEEVSNDWGLLVGRSASKKSPTLRRMCAPLRGLEALAAEKHIHEMKEYRKQKKAAELAKQDFDEPEPRLRRYITDDSTTPKLRELFSSNPRGLILRSDELKGQVQRFDRDGSEGDRSFMMQCWSGLEYYNEDRINRGSLLQIPLTLTWIGGIQPSCLSQYLRQAMSDGAGADGFMQRFQMVTYPDFNQPFETPQGFMPEELENKIQQLFIDIDQMTLSESRKLTFDSEAQEYFDALERTNENECRSGGHPSYWESHLGKQPKLLAALCIILHVLKEQCKGNRQNEISLETLQEAEKIRQYYLAHALRCYESVGSAEMEDARKILDLVKRKKLPSKFKQADIYQNNLGGIKDSSRVSAALRLLQELRYVAVERSSGFGTGRPSETWIVHPKVLEKN